MYKIEKMIMSGRGPRVLWKITLDGITLFKTSTNAHHAWTKKKDAKKVVELIETYGVDYVEKRISENTL